MIKKLFISAVFLISLPVYAAPSFDTLHLRPASDHGLYLETYGTDSLKQFDWSAGFYLDYAREPLGLVSATGASLPVVRDLVGGHLAGSFGVTDWIEVGLAPNVALMEKFFDPVTQVPSTRVRLGDVRVNAKFQLLNKEKYDFGIAIIPYLDLPSGNGDSFVGNNGFAGGGTVAFETKRVEDRLSFALNMGYFTREKASILGTTTNDQVTFGAGANFLVVSHLEVLGEFRGAATLSEFFSNTAATPFEGGGGARYFFDRERRWQLTSLIGAGIGAGLGNPVIRAVAGIAYTPSRRVRGVELEESAKGAFEVYELKNPSEMDQLRQTCPEKKLFNPKKDDPRCIKLYLSE